MAIDKLVDSTQLDTDLTTVANAIRAKGGTNNSLEFPDEFVAAIENIPTGGFPEKEVNFIDMMVQYFIPIRQKNLRIYLFCQQIQRMKSSLLKDGIGH